MMISSRQRSILSEDLMLFAAYSYHGVEFINSEHLLTCRDWMSGMRGRKRKLSYYIAHNFFHGQFPIVRVSGEFAQRVICLMDVY